MLERRGGWVVVGLLSLGCSTSVSTAVVENRLNEQRVPMDAASPRLHVSWQHGRNAIVAQLSPQQCRNDRAWVDSETRTTVRSPMRWVTPTAYGFATATSLLFAVTYDGELDFKCDGQSVDPRPNVVYPGVLMRLAIVTYDLQPPYDYAAANDIMTNAGFARSRTAANGKIVALTNTTWFADVDAQSATRARDEIADALERRFAMRGLHAKILVVIGDDWAWGMRSA